MNENSVLKEQLQEVLKRQEDLSARLEVTHESDKQVKKTLEMVFEKLKSMQNKMTDVLKGPEQIKEFEMAEREAKLQELLGNASERERAVLCRRSRVPDVQRRTTARGFTAVVYQGRSLPHTNSATKISRNW